MFLFLKFCKLAPSYSPASSTIAVTDLHFCVRNENRCYLRTKAPDYKILKFSGFPEFWKLSKTISKILGVIQPIKNQQLHYPELRENIKDIFSQFWVRDYCIYKRSNVSERSIDNLRREDSAPKTVHSSAPNQHHLKLS